MPGRFRVCTAARCGSIWRCRETLSWSGCAAKVLVPAVKQHTKAAMRRS